MERMNHLPVIALPFWLAYSYHYGFIPLLLPLLFVLASIITYFAYAKDKSAAEKSEWRIPENTLHMHSLLFGWPGAIIAQQRFRHKTKKASFRIVFWLTVVVNVSAIGWAHTQEGNKILSSTIVKLEGVLLNNVTDRNAAKVIRFLTGFNGKSFGYIHKS